MYNWVRTERAVQGTSSLRKCSGVSQELAVSGTRIERTLAATRTIGFDVVLAPAAFVFLDGSAALFLDGGIVCQP